MNFLEAIKQMENRKIIQDTKDGLKYRIKNGVLQFLRRDIEWSKSRLQAHILAKCDWKIVQTKRPLSYWRKRIEEVKTYRDNTEWLKEDDVHESLKEFIIWITVEHAPDKSSPRVLDKAKEIFGEELLKWDGIYERKSNL